MQLIPIKIYFQNQSSPSIKGPESGRWEFPMWIKRSAVASLNDNLNDFKQTIEGLVNVKQRLSANPASI